MTVGTRLGTRLVVLLALAMVGATSQEAKALIHGGEGNNPIRDPGWPAGAAVIFNTPARIAWWEGPAFGGGQWHAECHGDAKELSVVLADFAKLDVKDKRVVLYDGMGLSSWLSRTNDPAKRNAARIDWHFVVWQARSWHQLRRLPADLNPIGAADAENGPPSHIDVYTGGTIRWADVTVPKGLKIVDQRLEAHGFTLADGVVLEGKVTDLATGKPIPAKVRLERIEPQAKGGYQYRTVAEAATDAEGRWVLKKAPAGWQRVVLAADGFVPRVAGHLEIDDQPRWHEYKAGLARPAHLAGRITNDAGQPLADVEVRLRNLTAGSAEPYPSPLDYTVKTAADGRFRVEQVPGGTATVWLHKPGYIRPGLAQPISTPKDDVELSMTRSARIVVTVDFTGKKRPAGYLVKIEPEGGAAIGKYGGSGNINDKNQMVFDHVPPGRYVLHGQPNPSSGNQQTEPVKVDLKGGENVEVKLGAK